MSVSERTTPTEHPLSVALGSQHDWRWLYEPDSHLVVILHTSGFWFQVASAWLTEDWGSTQGEVDAFAVAVRDALAHGRTGRHIATVGRSEGSWTVTFAEVQNYPEQNH